MGVKIGDALHVKVSEQLSHIICDELFSLGVQ